MNLLSSAQPTTPSPASNLDPMDMTCGAVSADHVPLSPPASPTFAAPKFPLRDAKVNNYKKPTKTPRFPRHPCPTANYNLSLLSAEHQAQRLFGQSFTLRNPITGELLGPFAVLSYTDGWIPRYCNYIHSIVSSSLFTLRERELIVLAVASVTRAEYVIYAHRRIAASVGLKDETIDAALARYGWMDMISLSPREKNVYRIASEMAGNWGRVSDETWSAVVVKDKPKAKGQEGWLEREFVGVEKVVEDAGEERLQRGEVAMLAQVLASTMFVSVLVNCADLDIGEKEEGVGQP
jgi:AhpD family alkylhydroperoxidase